MEENIPVNNEDRRNAALEQAGKIARRVAELDVLIEKGEANKKMLLQGDSRRTYSERNLPGWIEERRLLSKGLLNELPDEVDIDSALEGLEKTN